MKKLSVLALCFIALSACNRDKKRVIAVIPKGNAHLFWQSVHAGAVSTSRETGVDIIWDGPASETDYTGQLKVVDAMINRRVDAICLAPIDSKAMTFESHLASGTHQRTATNCQACPRSNLSAIRPVRTNKYLTPRCSTPFVRFSAIRPHF